MATTHLTRTQSNTGSETKGTFSAWIKRSKLGGLQKIFTSYQGNSEFFVIDFQSSNKLQLNLQMNGSDYLLLLTSRVFRDTSAWLHIVVTIDSTDSTQADRVKLYVNGVRETAFDTNTNSISSSLNMRINSSSQNPFIGSFSGSSEYFDGLMSHIHWVDGTAYQASTFGSTDSTTGEWKINTSPSVTYGTNGFFILKDGNSVTDQSGQSNNLTVGGGTLTNTEDCPSNVFATLNYLYKPTGSQTYANAMTTVGGDGGPRFYNATTLGANTGKFYCEAKINNINSGAAIQLGITANPQANNQSNTEPGANTYSYAMRQTDGQIIYNNSGNSYGTSYTTNDIIGIAMDLDNNKLYFSKNGTFMNSANPSSGTGGFSITDVDTIAGTNGFYHFAVGDDSSSQGGNNSIGFNFGNGFFGSTAISSEGTNASGIGKFEYDVPTGYTALSTKGLNA